VRRIEKAGNDATVRTDIVVNNPAFTVVIFAFVVRFVRVPGERVIASSVAALISLSSEAVLFQPAFTERPSRERDLSAVSSPNVT
jgi:hypothetical protein